MNSTRWARVRWILEAALELEGAERAALLERECGAEQDLRREVESLLGVDASGRELKPPAAGELASALGDPNLGRRVGPYTLERQIGSGGMGVVYLARRSAADFEQRVALKLIKRGMDTEDILRQFRRERALLAGLEHPSIARLQDGGTTEDGLPWLAMEYVEGLPIDAWCEAQRLSIRARVELFVRVTEAVRHAHQRLIVHRDLKPSNILVDGQGTPKLLDFGIAKLLGADSVSTATRTEAQQRRLTPDYASPEQLKGEVVTTATDVYSLGVVLYELLTGVNPQSGVGIERRADPERPSTRVRLVHTGAAPPSGQRGRDLRGDLDTITLTALAQDPARRYASVEALELDLRRYLEGLPIVARPATAGYRLSKFVARNRIAVAGALAVFASLCTGLALARSGYREAVLQRGKAEVRQARAEKEARRANAVLKLTREMLAGASPHDVKDKDYTLRQLLDEFDGRLDAEAGAEPEVEASIRQILGRAYRELGLLDKAEPHIARALELQPEALRSQDEASLALAMEWIALLHDRGEWARAESQCTDLLERLSGESAATSGRSDLLVLRGDLRRHLRLLEPAEADLRAALVLLESAAPPDPRALITCLGNLAMTFEAPEDRAEARALGRRALELAREHLGPQSSQTARMLNNLGHASLEEGRYADAESELREAVAIERELREEHDHARAPSLSNLGRALTSLGRYAEAEPVLREAVALTREGLGDRHPSLASNLSNLANLLENRGDNEGAASAMREALEIRVAHFGDRSVEVARARNNLGVLLRGMGRFEESEQELRRALELRRELLGERDVAVASTQGSLGATLLARGDLEQAEANVREALSIFRAELGPAHPQLASCLASLGSVRLRQHDWTEARALALEGLSMRRELLGVEHPDIARSLSQLGEILAAAGDLPAAELRLREAEAMQRKLLGPAHGSLARTLFLLGDVADRSARPEEAQRFLSEALAIWRKSPGAPGQETREAGTRLAALLEGAGDLEGAARVRSEWGLVEALPGETRSQ